jgi:phosphomannomutase
MADSLKFGTSGLRGLAAELEGAAARRYVAAFLRHLSKRRIAGYNRVFIARDLRASSPSIAADCAVAVRAAGLVPVDCGVLPTSALAVYAMAEGGPAIMVTGSHIPADRNGLKFYTPQGEITKEDELGILGALVDAEPADGPSDAEDGHAAAGDRYRQRYRQFLAPTALSGWTVGVFEHSSVARDHLASLLYRAGARVVRLERSDTFVPVDTEAFSDAIYAPRHRWIEQNRLDAIVSTDGDGDRPLLIDAEGNFVRGDVIGLLTAQFLSADTVVTPVTSNSAIEALGAFQTVERTRVGSPYVILGMEEAAHSGGTVVGFEANGGTLLGTDVEVDGRTLSRLPTRDAILPLLAVLATAARQGRPLAQVIADLPVRPALSDRLTEAPTDRSAAFTARLGNEPEYAREFFSGIGEVANMTAIDGPRFTLKSGDVVHYRPSGNAPELRCYVEARTDERAEILLRWGLDAAAKVVRAGE